jgi:hypothetical protein
VAFSEWLSRAWSGAHHIVQQQADEPPTFFSAPQHKRHPLCRQEIVKREDVMPEIALMNPSKETDNKLRWWADVEGVPFKLYIPEVARSRAMAG